jgi:hypothetical protein
LPEPISNEEAAIVETNFAKTFPKEMLERLTPPSLLE